MKKKMKIEDKINQQISNHDVEQWFFMKGMMKMLSFSKKWVLLILTYVHKVSDLVIINQRQNDSLLRCCRLKDSNKEILYRIIVFFLCHAQRIYLFFIFCISFSLNLHDVIDF